ncbi:hypothetical protein GIB67_019867 [Kingdonia uniflora]|uniref:SHSP domain-containing protein n=1 Tax=Kingdonia uniflora TaxID=39325 RepID=A0A7J7MKE0_9MAGN|nr:hypothetical protein GIB67_019867 [Kingdonia uniflora]
MSSAISNLTVFAPLFPFQRNTASSKALSQTFLPSPLRPTGRNLCRSMKAMVAGEGGRDNLDHLQRVSNLQQQNQPKKKRPVPSLQVSPIGLWDGFPTARTVQQMMETMERIMEDPFAYNNNWPSSLPREDVGGYRRGRTPWEIKEDENDYKMRFDMPGMTKKDVKVWVEDKMLVVKAEKVAKKKDGTLENEGEGEEGGEWSAKSYGRYSCRIALPENVEFDKIKAEVKDGVLYISIPKASATSKILDINVH